MSRYDDWKCDPGPEPPEPEPLHLDLWVGFDDSDPHTPWQVVVETSAPAPSFYGYGSVSLATRPSYPSLVKRWPVLDGAVVSITVERA